MRLPYTTGLELMRGGVVATPVESPPEMVVCAIVLMMRERWRAVVEVDQRSRVVQIVKERARWDSLLPQ